LTRYSSAFLTLESFKHAYDKKALDDEIVCTVDLKSIEIYLQILNPDLKLSSFDEE
jgi:hypothetical protein